jgi:hypothetical protein
LLECEKKGEKRAGTCTSWSREAYLANERFNAAGDTAVLARAAALLLVDVVKPGVGKLVSFQNVSGNVDTESAAVLERWRQGSQWILT